MTVHGSAYRAGGLVLAAGLMGPGCAKTKVASIAPDPCDAGCVPGCQSPLCELEAAGGETITTHSPSQGVFADADVSCPPGFDEDAARKAFNDTKIPEFSSRRTRRTNFSRGRAYLQDHELHEHLLAVQGRIFDCIDLVSCYADPPPAVGELDFEFELAPSGRVSAVSVEPSEQLALPDIVSCARRAVYEHKFPSFSGAHMFVTYNVKIDEVEG